MSRGGRSVDMDLRNSTQCKSYKLKRAHNATASPSLLAKVSTTVQS